MSVQFAKLVRTGGPDADPSWEDGWRLTADPVTVRGVIWCRRGLADASGRAARASAIAFDHWAAAVEAVWWAVALDDVLYSLHDGRYPESRGNCPDGQAVVGLRWLRHQHAHRIVVTGEGGPKRDFFGETGGPPFFISPSNTWLRRSAIPTAGRQRDQAAEIAYDSHVAGRALEGPVAQALAWFDVVLVAGGLDPTQTMSGSDPTVL